MNMNFRNSILVLLIGSLAIIGCKKDFDSPPVAVLPQGNIITIDSLRKIYTSFDSTFVNDISVYGTVTADEISGNLYKTIYIQDATNAIQLSLTSSSSKLFFQGDKVRVALKGLTITRGATSSGAPINMIQVKNVNPEINIIKQGKGDEIAPKVVTIADLAISGIYSPYQGQLVQLNNVEFQCSDIHGSYASVECYEDANKILLDSNGASIIVRNSAYSNFAGTPIAKGRGNVVAIVSQYRSDVQLTLRKLEDVVLNGQRRVSCPFYSKDYEDKCVLSGKWISQNKIGNIDWETANVGSNGTNYAMISNFVNSSNLACETWLVSPEFDLSGLSTPKLSFQSAYNYSGAQLKLYVTTSYSGDVTTTSWNDISSLVTWSSGGWAWKNSSDIDLSSYKQNGVRFAFKYIGTTSDGSTWEIDDFTINDL